MQRFITLSVALAATWEVTMAQDEATAEAARLKIMDDSLEYGLSNFVDKALDLGTNSVDRIAELAETEIQKYDALREVAEQYKNEWINAFEAMKQGQQFDIAGLMDRGTDDWFNAYHTSAGGVIRSVAELMKYEMQNNLNEMKDYVKAITTELYHKTKDWKENGTPIDPEEKFEEHEEELSEEDSSEEHEATEEPTELTTEAPDAPTELPSTFADYEHAPFADAAHDAPTELPSTFADYEHAPFADAAHDHDLSRLLRVAGN